MITFTLKAFYVAGLALILSIVHAMVGFALFDGVVEEELMSAVLMPSWVFIFGFLVAFVEQWWRLRDPEATIEVWGISVRFYGYFISAIALYLFFDAFQTYGWISALQTSVSLTLGSVFVLLAAYFIKKALRKSKSA